MAASTRLKFDRILLKWGWDIYLQRRINRSSDVPEYEKNVLERHTVRSSFPGGGSGLPGIVEEADAGLMHDVDLVYYFRWNANPEEGDRILDIPHPRDVPNDDTVDRNYTIDWALPMRGRGGRIDFWSVGVTRERE